MPDKLPALSTRNRLVRSGFGGCSRAHVKLGVGTQTGIYDSVVATVLFAAGAIVLGILGPTPIAGAIAVVVAALVNVAIRHARPSPEARADRETIARLQRQIAKFNSPQRVVDDQAALNRRRRSGPMFGSRDS
jgi:hypothetical protein